MRLGLIALLIAALALPASAGGQTPPATQTPTATATPAPTSTPTPTPEELEQQRERERLRKKTVVRRVYADFRRDGRIDGCEHERESLKMARRSIDSEFAQDFPDFRAAVTAAIRDHDEEECAEQEESNQGAGSGDAGGDGDSGDSGDDGDDGGGGSGDDGGGGGGGDTTPSATPAPTTTPAPTPAPTSTPSPITPETGGLPDPPRDRDRDDGAPPPSNTDPPPSEGDVTPVQPAPTPAPPPPPPEAQMVVTNPDRDASLLLPAVLLVGALLGLALTGGSAVAARRVPRFAGWGHAWREAAYRASGAWSDFSDWLRLGR